MILSAIKYRVRSEDKPRLYRFQAPRGGTRNFFCHTASKAEAADFAKAILFALKGEANSSISDVTFYFTDDAGDSWVIERTPFKSRIFLNRQEVREDADQALRAALFDLGTVNVQNAADPAPLCKRYELHEEEDGQIFAFQMSNESQFQNNLKKEVEEQSRKTIHGLKKFLGTETYLDASLLGKLVSRLEPAYYTVKEINKQLSLLKEECGKYAGIDPEHIYRLATELELMQQLEATAAPLLEPGKNPSILAEKLKEVEGKLKTICRKNDIQTLPINDAGINWEATILQLSRMRASENLRNAFMEIYEKYRRHMSPAFDQYFETVETLLQNDLQITSELQNCLQALTASVQRKQSPEADAPNFFGKLWSRVKNPPALPEEVSLVSEAPRHNKELDNARMAVDYALGRLGELHSNIKAAGGIQEDILLALEEKREKLFGDYEKLRQDWEVLAKKHNLPPDSSIRSLLGLVNNYSQIADLWQQRETLRNQIKAYKQGLATLEKLILEWRHNTGSQKQTPLATPAIITAEARGILEYKQKKKDQFERLKDHEARIASFREIAQRLEGRLNQVRAEWQGAFEAVGLPPKTIDNDGWSLFFGTARKLSALASLAKETLQPLKNEDIFSQKALDTPLTIFYWNYEVSYNKSRSQILSFLKKAGESGCGLILMADPQLGKALGEADLGMTTPVAPPEKKKPEVRSSANPTAATSQVLSGRARDALAILTGDGKKRPLDRT